MATNNDPGDLISTVTFSDMERNSQTPSEEHLAEAISLFQEYGFVRLNNIFDPDVMRQWDAHYRKRYKSYLHSTNQPNKRPLFTVDVEGPFNDPYFYANPLLMPFYKQFLGEDCILGSLSSVVSFPGAPDQHLHRDSPALFGNDYTFDVNIPSYAMDILIPLVDCTLETGCTKVWPGSHKCKTDDEALQINCLEPEVKVGSVLMTNSKLVHRGGANHSEIIRPLIYLQLHRHWFRDFSGYEERPPVNIGNRELEKVPGEYRHMFTWTKDPYRVIRIKNWLRRVLPGSLRQLRRGGNKPGPS